MSEELENFSKRLKLKYELLTQDEKTLLTNYQTKEDYQDLLVSIHLLLTNDTALLEYSKVLISKLESLINIHRFTITDKFYLNLLNSIIISLNNLKNINLSNKIIHITNYRLYEEQLRCLSFSSDVEFLGAISYDYLFFLALLNGNINDFQPELFLSITNYFLNQIPTIYKIPSVKSLTLNYLSNLKAQISPLNIKTKKYIKQTEYLLEKELEKE